jgi:hypothetical protein
MGIRLIVEILDHWQDHGLTPGERDDLIVIAEQARDETRETVASVHRPFILKRVNKTPKSWRTAIDKLMRKKVLEHAVVGGRKVMGHEGQAARYRIPYLCPLRDHDGRYGQCERPERVISQRTHSPQEGPLTDDALAQEGPLTEVSGSSDRGQEGPLTDDPSPSYPSEPSKDSAAHSHGDDHAQQQDEPAVGRKPRKRATTKKAAAPKPNRHQVADELTAAFWKVHGNGRTQKYVAVQKIVRDAISNGVERDDLARALDHVAREGSIVGWKLDNFLAGLKNGRAGATAPIPTHDDANNGAVIYSIRSNRK